MRKKPTQSDASGQESRDGASMSSASDRRPSTGSDDRGSPRLGGREAPGSRVAAWILALTPFLLLLLVWWLDRVVFS
jgi:hypothetical protein